MAQYHGWSLDIVSLPDVNSHSSSSALHAGDLSCAKSAQYHASNLTLVLGACLLGIFCIQGEIYDISRVVYDRQIDLCVISEPSVTRDEGLASGTARKNA